MTSPKITRLSGFSAILFGICSNLLGQSVGLPAPRLLTTMPMGGKVGTEVEVVITGEHLDDVGDLLFSDPHITAKRKLDPSGKAELNKYVVTIAKDCPAGLYEARLMTRLGISSSRIFAVGTLNEVLQTKPNKSLATALELNLNSICNGTIADRAIDHFSFQAKKGQRVVVDCATRGIDSKLNATVIIADSNGRDLLVERRGGVLDFQVPKDGKYVIKIHELTFKGGPEFYYRLGLWEQPAGTPVVRQASTRNVNSFSWPPLGLSDQAKLAETEPNGDSTHSQRITLPCDLSGRFYPAADVDFFEFEAKKGEEWWIEVASERFGLPTDPSILVQHVTKGENGAPEKFTDVLELSDIPSPVKVSSNGYAYDGPPYNPGTSDILGKLVVKQDGLHRLQLTDLFGGTRKESGNIYRLIIRKAAPDFAVVAWAIHMELRNGDRNALSKPISLRGGATMALEVIAFRRDGFDGEIELSMEGLPEGVTAKGLKIPAGQSRGLILITASPKAPKSYTNVKFVSRAKVNGQPVTHPCHLASVAWPIPDSWGEIPSPRLLADVPVSVSGTDLAPITIASKSPMIEARVGEKLTIPLVYTKRSEFSGDKIQMKPIGAGFENAPAVTIPITTDSSQAVLDLAALKTQPGDYTIAFLGGAVAKYRHQPETVTSAEEASKKMALEVKTLEAELKKVSTEAESAPADKKEKAIKTVSVMNARMKAATVALNATKEQLKKATEASQPRDIADIVVTEPITIRIKPSEKK